MATNDTRIVITADDQTRAGLESAAKSMGRLGSAAESVSRNISSGASNAVRNASYQISDFVSQVQTGQRVSTALAQQLPQLLAGFGAFGAVAGIFAGLAPTIYSFFTGVSTQAKKLETAIGDLNDIIGDVGKASREFSMNKLYEEFNKANAVTRTAIVEQLRFQQAMLETQTLLANQSLSKTLEGMGDFSFLDKIKGAFGESGADKLAKELGVARETAADMLPAIRGLRNGSEDAGNFMARFGEALARSTNANAQKLVKDIKAVADGSKDAAAAQSRITEALQKMNAAGAKGKVSFTDPEAAKKAAGEWQQLNKQIDEASAALAIDAQATTKLTAAQSLSLKIMTDIQRGYLKLNDAQKATLAGKLEELLANDQLNQSTEARRKALQDEAKALDEYFREEEKGRQLVEDFIAQSRTMVERTTQQKEMIGLRERERQILVATRQLEDEADKKRREAFANIKDPALYAQKIGEINEALAKQKGSLAEATGAAYDYATSWEAGVKTALNGYLDEVSNVAAQSQRFFSNMFRGMEDALVNFVKTGKLDFRSLADSIISDIIRIQVQQSITKPLAEAISASGGLSDIFGGLFGGKRANGGPVTAGKAYIVGERQPELFVPSTSGTILPSVPTGGGGGGVTVSITQHIDSRSDQATIVAAANFAVQEAERRIYESMRRGGKFA